jgi:hypothetical protein
MGKERRPRYAIGELVTVHLADDGQGEATWRAGSVVAWCELEGETWVTVKWYDLDTLTFLSDLVPASHCRKVTPQGLRRATPS